MSRSRMIRTSDEEYAYISDAKHLMEKSILKKTGIKVNIPRGAIVAAGAKELLRLYGISI